MEEMAPIEGVIQIQGDITSKSTSDEIIHHFEGKKADIEKGKNIKEYAKENVTVEQAMLIAQIQKALKGDAQAFEMIRDLIGEKPIDKKEVSASVQHDNPFEGLTTEELKKLIDDE